jgi:hypothetical protein
MRKTRVRTSEEKSLGGSVASAFNRTTTALEWEGKHVPARWRAVSCAALVLSFVILVVFARVRSDFNRLPTLDWRSVLALADASRQSGDVNQARHLYIKVERLAVWQQDWTGLVAAACGIKRLDGATVPYSPVHQILFRAFIAAQNRQSRQGIATVAHVFRTMGEHRAAEMFLTHTRPEWPTESEASNESLLEGCVNTG